MLPISLACATSSSTSGENCFLSSVCSILAVELISRSFSTLSSRRVSSELGSSLTSVMLLDMLSSHATICFSSSLGFSSGTSSWVRMFSVFPISSIGACSSRMSLALDVLPSRASVDVVSVLSVAVVSYIYFTSSSETLFRGGRCCVSIAVILSTSTASFLSLEMSACLSWF
uniref:Uncharacterized protein n=1 Tax=Opuntia streptacantha TaxID=393608 RepID=A0A7C9A9I2_OPUST